MKYLCLLFILIASCTKKVTIEKRILTVLPRHSGEFCFKYLTYISYPVIGGISQSENKLVYIVIRANPTNKQSEIETMGDTELSVYGYYINTISTDNNNTWINARFVDSQEETDCKNLGRVFDRNNN